MIAFIGLISKYVGEVLCILVSSDAVMKFSSPVYLADYLF